MAGLACLLLSGHLHGQVYQNVAVQQGLGLLFTNSITFGHGVSFFDFNDDGWDDLTFTMRADSLEVYLNVAGQLQRQTPFLPPLGDLKHALWVDYDNDGDHDLFTTTFSGRHRLWNNNGQFQFTDVSQSAGFLFANEKNFGASWGDYDRDGFLDLYVCTYESEGTEADFARLNQLYRNNGDGTFTNVTLAAGVGNGIRLSFQSVWMDHDLDGWPDLFIINDRNYANTLYRNNGDGTFSDITDMAGVGFPENDPMTITVGDMDNDGDLDIFITNSGITDDMRCKLLVNNGDGTYTDRAQEFGVDVRSWSWGAVWVDQDNDGWLDLYFTTDFPNGALDSNYFFRNEEGLGFVSGNHLFEGPHTARSYGCARGDLNNEGYADIVAHNLVPDPPFLWASTGGSAHYIKIGLRGTVSNRQAVGSWIRVYAGGQCYVHYTLCGENYIGQDSQYRIFGLGQTTVVDSVQVLYPSGHMDTYLLPAIDTLHRSTEGETYTAQVSVQGPLSVCEDEVVLLDAGEHEAYLWSDGSTQRFLATAEAGAYWFTAWNAFGVAAWSDTVVVTISPLPHVLADLTPPACHGEATGSIVLTNAAGPAIAEVTWSNGAQGAALDGLAVGEYAYLLVDEFGCTATGSLTMVGPDPLTVVVETTPADGPAGGSLLLGLFGGTPPYTVLVNGEAAPTLLEGLPAGTYGLTVTDALGCLWQGEAVIDDAPGVANAAVPQVSLFPNPVHDVLHVLGMLAPLAEMVVTDMGGRTVLRSSGPLWQQVDVRALAPAAYHLQLVLQDGHRLTHTFIKAP